MIIHTVCSKSKWEYLTLSKENWKTEYIPGVSKVHERLKLFKSKKNKKYIQGFQKYM